ncbi:MAG TPA: S8 family serine peptidase [Candidatus Acidoferrales bacterium]|nr:S8 family serine peptidase [Candidatus Acidoferrales bacterium]
MNGWGKFVLVVCLSAAFNFAAGAQTNSLTWHRVSGRVDANIHSEDLLPLLQDIATQTGWHVYLEPGTTHTVSAKFHNRPTGDALKMLFGDLNFAYVPKVGSVSQLYIFQTEMKNATHLVSAKKPKHVANELLVKVKPGTDIKTLAKILGAKITGQMDKYGAYRLQFPDADATDTALTQVQNNSDVQNVDYNYYFDQPPTSQEASSAPSSLSLSLNPPPASGKTIVGLIDTSVDAQSLGPDAAQFVLPQINVADGTSSDSGPSHGTAMAAQILQTVQSIQGTMGNNSTSLQIQPVNVYGSGETTTSWDVAQGIQAAVNAGATVLNMSLGSSGDSSVLDAVVAEAASDGITMFAAAGNTPTDAPYYPAADSGVHAVTALSQPGELASYANTWPDPTMMALPGTGSFNFDGQSWVVQGTSTSSAIAAGVDAAYASDGWSQTKITTAMTLKWPLPTR